MNYYVVGYLPRAADPARPDLRTGRIVSGHTERAIAERLADGLHWTSVFAPRIYVVREAGELRGHLRRAWLEGGEGR